MLRITRQATVTDRLNVRRIEAFFQRQERMESNSPGAAVCDRVCQQQRLDLCLGETSGMDLLEYANQTVDQFRRSGHRACNVWNHAKSLCKRLKRGLRLVRCGFERIEGKVSHDFSSRLDELGK